MLRGSFLQVRVVQCNIEVQMCREISICFAPCELSCGGKVCIHSIISGSYPAGIQGCVEASITPLRSIALLDGFFSKIKVET